MGLCIALAFPDRIAKRRDASGETRASVGGRGFKLDPTSSLARNEWLAVAETQGMAAGARILSAAPIDLATVESLFGDRIETRRTVSFDPATGGVQALRERRLGAIRLSSGPDAHADPEAIAAALLSGVRAQGLSLLPWSEAALALLDRIAFVRGAGVSIEDIDEAALLARADEWLTPLLAGKRRLDAIDPGALAEALRGVIGWDTLRVLDAQAPTHFHSPAGTSHPIDYAAEGGPRVDLRPQALFGLAAHPMIAGMEIIVRYTAMTCVGVNPSAFSTPMCLKPETTAPLTTLATIRTATASPSQPNTIRNGTNVFGSPVASARSPRYDCVPTSAPDGSPDVTAA